MITRILLKEMRPLAKMLNHRAKHELLCKRKPERRDSLWTEVETCKIEDVSTGTNRMGGVRVGCPEARETHSVTETREQFVTLLLCEVLIRPSPKHLIKVYLLHIKWLCARGSLAGREEKPSFTWAITLWSGTRGLEIRP